MALMTLLMLVLVTSAVSRGATSEEISEDPTGPKSYKSPDKPDTKRTTKFKVGDLDEAIPEEGDDKPREEQSRDFFDEMPRQYVEMFQSTVYFEVYLYSFVVFYGLLHLPLWEKIYDKVVSWIPTADTST